MWLDALRALGRVGLFLFGMDGTGEFSRMPSLGKEFLMKRTRHNPAPRVFSGQKIKGRKAPSFPSFEFLEPRALLSAGVDVLASVVHGNLNIRGTAAADVILLDQAGLNADQVRITGSGGTTINGQASVVLSGLTGKVDIRMGAGDDSVTLEDMSLPSNVSVDGQKGDNTLSLDTVQIAQSLVITNSASRSSTIAIGDTTIGKDLMILPCSGAETIALRSVEVQRNSLLVSGKGADVVTVDDSTFHGSVKLYTGQGADAVQIDANGDPLDSPTLFDGRVTILLGGDDDTLRLGVAGDTGNRSVFAAKATFDGGAGIDALFNFDGNTYTGKFRVTRFESNGQVAQASVDLGAADPFAVMATASITSTGLATQINGDVGLNPGTSQGIPPGQVNGAIHVDDPTAIAAQASLLAAYNEIIARSVGSVSLPGNLGGLTFTPGLYTNSTSVLISGSGPGNDVTLDAQGDANAIFIFKMGSTLTTGPGAQVILAGGAKADNVFWQVGSSATLNTTTIFKGNILASVTITVNTGSVVEGRLLAGSNSDGSVTINASTVTVPV